MRNETANTYKPTLTLITSSLIKTIKKRDLEPFMAFSYKFYIIFEQSVNFRKD